MRKTPRRQRRHGIERPGKKGAQYTLVPPWRGFSGRGADVTDDTVKILGIYYGARTAKRVCAMTKGASNP
jgi:hypothetical protein